MSVAALCWEMVSNMVGIMRVYVLRLGVNSFYKL
jgi:hypothetical protein